MLAVREILTPQQRQELESLRRERFRRPTPPPTP
jgi:Spy/CpxP family protein refolding chaperone